MDDNIDEVWNLLLKMNIRDDDKDMDKFLENHPEKHIEKNKFECILLFQPEIEEKFNKCLTRFGETISKEVVKQSGASKLYYLNNCLSVGEVENFLDRIFEKQNGKDFRIACDCGFIAEIHGGNETKYKVVPPHEEQVWRSIPKFIHFQADMDKYKKYIKSFVSEKMELTHESSNVRFVAIHTFMFQVFNVNKETEQLNKETELPPTNKEFEEVDRQVDEIIRRQRQADKEAEELQIAKLEHDELEFSD